jgi:hypothetical protein
MLLTVITDLCRNNTGNDICKMVLKQIPSFEPHVAHCAAFCASAPLKLFCLTSKDPLYTFDITNRDMIRVVLDIPDRAVEGDHHPELGTQEELLPPSRTGCFHRSTSTCLFCSPSSTCTTYPDIGNSTSDHPGTETLSAFPASNKGSSRNSDTSYTTCEATSLGTYLCSLHPRAGKLIGTKIATYQAGCPPANKTLISRQCRFPQQTMRSISQLHGQYIRQLT